MGRFGPTEILLVVAMIFILFGAKRIPEFVRGLADGVRELRKARDEVNKT
jgi:sec-independent protein translocase protein TatA